MSDMTQKNLDTALLNECKNIKENLGEVQQLIADGANINAVTGAGRTPLMSATAYGHINIVRFLLENGADINIKDTHNGWTALMFSTGLENEEFEIAKLLIENGADVNETSTKHGATALMMACNKCYFKSAKLLIETPNINLGITSNGGLTALDFANRYCGERITSLFPVGDIESESQSQSENDFEHVSISKSDIPEEAWNSVAYGDENVTEFLAENIKNKIFKFNTAYYAVGGEGIKQHYLSGKNKIKNTFYPCFSVGTSIRPHDENVDKSKPLFLLSNIGPLTNFVLMKEFIKALKSDDQYFEIITDDAEDIPTSTSAQMLGSNPNAVSANHCQSGKAAKIFKLAIIDIVEEESKATKSTKATKEEEEEEEEAKGVKKRIKRKQIKHTRKTRKARKTRKSRKTRKTRKSRKTRKIRKTKKTRTNRK
jgi:hypothetical protein